MKQKLVLAGVAVVAAVVLAYIFNELFTHLIVIPIGHFFAVLQIFIESVPQFVVWVIVLVILMILVARTLFVVKGLFKLPSRPMMRRNMGPVESWQDWIDRAGTGKYFQGKLANRIADLSLSILSFKHEISIKEALRRVESGQIELPSSVAAYIQTGVEKEAWGSFDHSVPLGRLASLGKKSQRGEVAEEVREVVEVLNKKLRG